MKNCMYAILLILALSSFSTKSSASSVNHSTAFQNDTIPAQFPGGAAGWKKFLEKKMNRDHAFPSKLLKDHVIDENNHAKQQLSLQLPDIERNVH
jgi:hypothetical protein